MSGWISVNDRLPISEHELLGHYNVITVIAYGMGVVFPTTFMAGNTMGFWSSFGNIPCGVFDITHWMPLPEPPKCKEST